MQQAWPDAVAVSIGRLEARKPQVRVCGYTAKQKLDVGDFEILPCFDERVQPAGHHRTDAGAEQVALDHAPRHAVEAHGIAERRRLVRTVEHERDCDVVLQVLANRKINLRRHANRPQMVRRTDA